MAEKVKDPAKVLLKNVRLSYPALWKAKAFGGKGGNNNGTSEPKFQANFLMEKDDGLGAKNIAKLEDAIDHVKKAKWPKGAPKLAAAKICLKDSEDMEEMSDGYEGCMYVSTSNAKKPRVLDSDGLDVNEGDDEAPYAGCFVDAIVRVWAQDNEYGKRINCSLEGVKFRADGEAFGAAPIDADDFDDDDDEPAPKSKGKRRPADDEDDEPAPKKRRAAAEDEDEGDKPRSRRRPADDEDDEPAPKKRRPAAEDDEEEDKPRSRRRPADEYDEDEPPRRRR